MHSNIQLSAISFAILALIAGCGSGTSSTTAQGAPTTTISSVSGAAVKGPIANAEVCFYELLTSGKGTLLACTNTDSSGNYKINLSYAGAVYMEAKGGTYTDETTGLNTTLTTPLSSIGIINGNGSVVVATPLTTMAVTQALINSNLTLPNFNVAAANVSNIFGVTGSITTTIPNTTIGANSSYGSALLSVSKMLNSGMNLSSITRSTNLTQLQQTGNAAAQCVIAAEIGNVTSTPLMAGIFYTTAPTNSASALSSSRLRAALATSSSGHITYTNVTTISNGTLSFANGTSQLLNCIPYSNVSIYGENPYLSGFACGVNFNGTQTIIGTSQNSSPSITINPNTPFYIYGSTALIGNVSGLNNVNGNVSSGTPINLTSIGGNLNLSSGGGYGNGTIFGTSSTGSGVSFNTSNSAITLNTNNSGNTSSGVYFSSANSSCLGCVVNSTPSFNITFPTNISLNATNYTAVNPISPSNITLNVSSATNSSGVINATTRFLNPHIGASIANVTVVGGNGTARSIFTATEPDFAWRGLITACGTTVMGCTVTKNVPRQVVLDCPATALNSGNISLYSGTWLPLVPLITALPSSGLTIMARRIDVNGSILSGINVVFNNTCPANLQALNMTLPKI